MKNYLKLFGSCLFLYVFFAYFTPYIAQFFPNWTHYVQVCEERNLDPGALYYTNLPIIYESEQANREAVQEAYGSILGFLPVKEK